MTNTTRPEAFAFPRINPTSLDAFGNTKVASPTSLFESKQLYDNLPLFWDDAEVSGSGTGSTHSTDSASTTLTIAIGTAGKRVRQTYRRFNYQAGKAQQLKATFNFWGAQTGITKSVHYGDDDNGASLRLDGDGTISMVVRSSVTGTPVDTVIPQSEWNIDRMDGTGMSRIQLDMSKVQIFYLDLEWLGVGSVRFGFFIDSQLYIAHSQDHANKAEKVYMSTPNLPVRYEIQGDGTNTEEGVLEQICTTVESSGGQDQLGRTIGIGRGATIFDAVGTGDTCALLSLRLKSTHIGASIIPISLNIVCTTSANFQWSLIMNPTVAGTDQASWVGITNSAVEYDISRDNTNTLSSGNVLATGYVTQSSDEIQLSLQPTLLLGSAIDGTRDELILAVTSLTGGGGEDFYASMNVRELL